jgi:hypothetical protein
MFLSRLNDPGYCVAQAEMARRHAEQQRNYRTKVSLLKIANGYIRIAKKLKKHQAAPLKHAARCAD